MTRNFPAAGLATVDWTAAFANWWSKWKPGSGESIPLACQDWANTKAVYRFFSNDRVSEEDILRGHFDATRRRFAASDGPILILHDTTEFSWRRRRPEAVGFTTKVSSGKDKSGRDRMHTVCGLLMHSSLAVTTDGLPLGMAAVKFWTRKKFQGNERPLEEDQSNAHADRGQGEHALAGQPAPIHPACWAIPRACVHICDREGDIWELFCLARELDTHFLVRRCSDRLAGDGSTYGGIDHGRGEDPGAAPGRCPWTTRESSAPHRSRSPTAG